MKHEIHRTNIKDLSGAAALDVAAQEKTVGGLTLKATATQAPRRKPIEMEPIIVYGGPEPCTCTSENRTCDVDYC